MGAVFSGREAVGTIDNERGKTVSNARWATTQESSAGSIDHSIEARNEEQQVKDAVYCWVLVNKPEVIEEARKLFSSFDNEGGE